MKQLARAWWPELVGIAVLLGASSLWAMQAGATGGFRPDAAYRLKESAKETLSLMEEMNKLLLSLSSLLIGAVVALVFREGQLDLPRTRLGVVHLFLIFYAAAFSMYFGFLVYAHMLEMTATGWFAAMNPSVQQPLESEYYLFLAAVALLILRVLAVGHDKPGGQGALGGAEMGDSL